LDDGIGHTFVSLIPNQTDPTQSDATTVVLPYFPTTVDTKVWPIPSSNCAHTLFWPNDDSYMSLGG